MFLLVFIFNFEFFICYCFFLKKVKLEGKKINVCFYMYLFNSGCLIEV